MISCSVVFSKFLHDVTSDRISIFIHLQTSVWTSFHICVYSHWSLVYQWLFYLNECAYIHIYVYIHFLCHLCYVCICLSSHFHNQFIYQETFKLILCLGYYENVATNTEVQKLIAIEIVFPLPQSKDGNNNMVILFVVVLRAFILLSLLTAKLRSYQ